MCRVIRVTNNYFDVDCGLKVGELVKAGECLAVVVSVSGEEPEYLKYAGELNREEIEKFMPDVAEKSVVSRCYVLRGMGENLSPEVGDEVSPATDEFIKEYHLRSGNFRIPYFYQMLKACDIEITKQVMLRLKKVFESKEIINVLLREIDYMIMHNLGLK